MPNWTENEVRFISKNKSSLTKLKKKLERKEKLRELASGKWTTVKNVFDFNKIIPMPKALIGTTSPTPMETKEDKKKAMENRSSNSQSSPDMSSLDKFEKMINQKI